MMGAVADRACADFLSLAARAVDGLDAVWSAPALRFLQDWVTQVTMAYSLAPFVYICLVFLVTHQDSVSSFIPQISLITAWVLVVLSFGFLVYYSHRVARSIQNPDMIGAIRRRLYVAAGRRTSSGLARAPARCPTPPRFCGQAETGPIVSCAKSGFLQHVDHGALVAAALAADALTY